MSGDWIEYRAISQYEGMLRQSPTFAIMVHRLLSGTAATAYGVAMFALRWPSAGAVPGETQRPERPETP